MIGLSPASILHIKVQNTNPSTLKQSNVNKENKYILNCRTCDYTVDISCYVHVYWIYGNINWNG